MAQYYAQIAAQLDNEDTEQLSGEPTDLSVGRSVRNLHLLSEEPSDFSLASSQRRNNDDEDQEHRMCNWKLVPDKSVYDDGLLRILHWHSVFQRRGLVGGMCNIGALVVLILSNFALQMTVVLRIITLVEMGHARTESKVFRPTGACLELSSGMVDSIASNFSQPLDTYWSCGPYLSMVLSNVDVLDVNKDGAWSKDDDLTASGKRWKETFRGLGGRIETVFEKTMLDIEQRNFRYQIQNGLTHDQTKEMTNGFQSIPMSWMHAEQSIFRLCNVANKDLCGNLELRGSLEVLFQTFGLDSVERMDVCHAALDRCESIFGEAFRSSRLLARETCGKTSTGFNEQHLVIVRRYENAEKYDKYTNRESITSYPYEVFLFLVLVLWWLAVVEEMRTVLSWWVVLLTIPSHDTVLKDDGQSLEIASISWWHKIPILFFINLPRTIIIVMLSWFGTEFLIVADSYTDLILNSLALTFLIEVDDMLFRAICSQNTKSTLENLQMIRGSHSCSSCCVRLSHELPHSMFFMVFVAFFAGLQGYIAYILPHGKFRLASAYRCMCHAEGLHCISAQLVGGDYYLDPEYI